MASSPSPTFSELLVEAFGTPETGALNFTALRQVIQAIVDKLGIEDEAIDQTRTAARDNRSVLELGERNASQSGSSCEESGEHRVLVANVSSLTEAVDDLMREVLQQKRMSELLLPTVEELKDFRASRCSSLHSEQDAGAPGSRSLAVRLDTIDETIGRLIVLVNDTMLEHSRMEKSLRPYLDGGELPMIRGQLDNINRLLKAHFPGYQSHCSSIGSDLHGSQPSTVPDDETGVPIDAPLEEHVPRRSTIQTEPMPDVGNELDTIRAVLLSLIARLPLAESESDTPDAASSHSLEQAVNSIGTVWVRQIEELLQSNLERIETLETTQQTHGKQADEVEKRVTTLHEALKRTAVGVESNFQALNAQMQGLIGSLEEQLNKLDRRCSQERTDSETRLTELEYQVEDRVNFEHFRTRLSRETFDRTVADLQRQMDGRVEQFTTDLELIWLQLEDTSAIVQTKCDKHELERTESRLQRRLAHMQLALVNLQRNIRQNVEAAGTKFPVGPETLRCVSCNHDATMHALAELIPTGKSLRAMEKERIGRIKQLSQLAAAIALRQSANEAFNLPKPGRQTTAKANMEPPNELAYRVRMKSGNDFVKP